MSDQNMNTLPITYTLAGLQSAEFYHSGGSIEVVSCPDHTVRVPYLETGQSISPAFRESDGTLIVEESVSGTEGNRFPSSDRSRLVLPADYALHNLVLTSGFGDITVKNVAVHALEKLLIATTWGDIELEQFQNGSEMTHVGIESDKGSITVSGAEFKFSEALRVVSNVGKIAMQEVQLVGSKESGAAVIGRMGQTIDKFDGTLKDRKVTVVSIDKLISAGQVDIIIGYGVGALRRSTARAWYVVKGPGGRLGADQNTNGERLPQTVADAELGPLLMRTIHSDYKKR